MAARVASRRPRRRLRQRPPVLLPIVAAAVVVVAVTEARADGLRRVGAAWLLPPGLERLAAAPGLKSPEAGPWLRAGHMRLHGLAELPVQGLSAGWGGDGWSVEAGWEKLGAGPLRDDRVATRWAWGRAWCAALRLAYRRLQVGPGPAGGALDAEVELGAGGRSGVLGTWRLVTSWSVARRAEPWLAPESARRFGFALAGPGRALALSLDLDAGGRPAFGWEALGSLGGGLGLSWRVDRASGATGPGLVCWRGLVRVRTSHLVHPQLGLTHRFEIGVGALAVAPW